MARSKVSGVSRGSAARDSASRLKVLAYIETGCKLRSKWSLPHSDGGNLCSSITSYILPATTGTSNTASMVKVAEFARKVENMKN